MEKVKTVDFSETTAACDLKVGRCRQLIDLMKICNNNNNNNKDFISRG